MKSINKIICYQLEIKYDIVRKAKTLDELADIVFEK